MIDHEARRQLLDAIDDYLAERIGAYKFDERMMDICTKDRTVRSVIDTLYCLYDDFIDHKVHATKQGWKLIQRLRLVLMSGAEFTIRKRVAGDECQVAAMSALIVASLLYFTAVASEIVCLGGCGIMAFILWWVEKAIREDLRHADPWNAWPFASLSSIQKALDAAPNFQRQRFRPEVDRPIRRGFWNANISLPPVLLVPFLIPLIPVWACMSPLVLLWQCRRITSKIELVDESTLPAAAT
jgi:hypothetical protein